MKREQFTKNISYFVLAVLIIIVYKTFDSLGILFSYIADFFALLSPVFWAFAIAFILLPLCKKTETIYAKIPKISSHTRGFAVATVYLAALAAVGGFLAIMLPVIFGSITDFIRHLPSIIQNVADYLHSLKIGDYSLKPLLNQITIGDIMAKLNLYSVDAYVDRLAGISKGIFNVILAIIISVYILLDRAGAHRLIRRLLFLFMPKKGRDVFSKYAYQTFNIMYKYVYCQLLDMCIVAFVAFIALIIMNVQYAPILAIFIGIANLVPYFGAVVACTLTAILTVFTTSLSKGILVAIVLIVLQQIDSNIIQPRIVKNTLKVKPFWVLCGVLVGGGLFGILGIVLAVPVMALIKAIFEDVYDYHITSERDEEIQEKQYAETKQSKT